MIFKHCDFPHGTACARDAGAGLDDAVSHLRLDAAAAVAWHKNV